jgi:hypothetical protein
VLVLPSQSFKVGEMLQKRTKNSKTWLNFDGSFTTEFHSSSIHFEDENGNLQNINTDLFDEADFDIIDLPVAAVGRERFHQSKREAIEGKKRGVINRDNHNFQGLMVPFDCQIPRNFQRGYTIGNGADSLNFKPVKASPSKGFISENDRSVITYQDVWNDTDVELKVLSNGIKETIILKTDRAPFFFSFEVKGNLADDLTSGEMKLAPAWLQDSNGEKRDVGQNLRREGNKTYIDLVADTKGLVYPIEIDPTVTIQPNAIAAKDTEVYEGLPNNNFGTNSFMRIFDSVYWQVMSLLQFDLSPIVGKVSNAKLYFTYYGDSESSFYTIQVGAFEVLTDWNESTVSWNTRPSVSGTQLGSVTMTHNINGGEYNIDISSIVKEWVDGTKVNRGLALKRVSGDTTYSYSLYTSDNSTVSVRPKIEVTYNAAPTTPTVTMPNGGETWNSLHTITWNPSTDTESAQSGLQYQIQLSTNNGATWKDIVTLTAAGATSYSYDFINEAESSTAKIRIRAFDGTSYGSWDESNGVFGIQHNNAPTTPTNLSPNGTAKDRTQIIRLSWLHNDANEDPQAKFDLQWRKQGASVWETITQITVNQYSDIPANLFTRGTVEWRVRTYDQSGLSAPYSDIATFFAGEKPTKPTIVNPGAMVAIANPTVQWSSDGQAGYLLTVKDSNSTVVFTSERMSTNKAETITHNLENLRNYTIELLIKNADGLYSDAAVLLISVSYTPPAIPLIETVKGDSFIQLNIEDSPPAGTQPQVLCHEIYKEVGGKFVLIANNIGYLFKDYHVGSGKTEKYFVRTIGVNNTFSDSLIFSEVITFIGVWLHIVDDPESTIKQFKFDRGGRSTKWGIEHTVTRFQGRKNPVVEIGEMSDYTVDFSLKLLNQNEFEALESIVCSQQTICYRDGRGRKEFGVFVDVPFSDEAWNGYSTSLSLLKVDFKEGI